MHANRTGSLTAHFVNALGERNIASLQTEDGHIVTYGKLNDGGILVTSTYIDGIDGSLRVSSLQVPGEQREKIELCRAHWDAEGALSAQESIVEPADLDNLLRLPKLPE